MEKSVMMGAKVVPARFKRTTGHSTGLLLLSYKASQVSAGKMRSGKARIALYKKRISKS